MKFPDWLDPLGKEELIAFLLVICLFLIPLAGLRGCRQEHGPNRCPGCGELLIEEPDGWYCVTGNCPNGGKQPPK